MGKLDALTFEVVEPRGYHLGGVWRRHKATRDMRRRIERAERQLTPLFEALVEASDPTENEAYRFEVKFGPQSTPWRKKRQVLGGRSVVDLRIHLPTVVQFLADDTALQATLRRWIAVAIQDELSELTTVQTLRDPVPDVPLLALSCVPRRGAAGRWHPDADVDAYARAASALGDLALPLLAERQVLSSWPTLELLPSSHTARVVPRQWDRAYAVPAAGASLMEPESLAARVATDFREALKLRDSHHSHSLGALADALGEHWRQAHYSMSLTTAPLRRDGHPHKLYVEFASNPTGGRFRPVVEAPGGRSSAAWQSTFGDAEDFVGLEPGVGYRWLADGRVQVNASTIRPARQVFDLLTDVSASGPNSTEPEGDYWSLLQDARAAATDDSIAAAGSALSTLVAGLTPASMLAFGQWWAQCDAALYQQPLLEAATEAIGFVSPDVFDDVRGWVILHGREVFNSIAHSPRSLSELDLVHLDQVEDAVGDLKLVYEQTLGSEFPDRLPSEPTGAATTC